jgi:hypothetical protein
MPLKHLSQRGDFNMPINLAIRREILIYRVMFLKVFLHPPPPSEREGFGPIVESRIPKMTILSIQK